jgi:hypothetical protein
LSTSLVIERLLPAPPDEVFAAWTMPDRMADWLSPTGHAEAEVDVRTSSAAEFERVDKALRALAPRLRGASVTTTRRSHKPPMERTDAIAALFGRARAIAAAIPSKGSA